VFLPIAFMEGNLGRLFRELAVAISAAVVISALVALTLSPMMCSKLLRASDGRGVSGAVNRVFRRLEAGYRRLLNLTLRRYVLMSAVVLGAIGLTAVLLTQVQSELTPPEDQGSMFVSLTGPEGAGFDYTVEQSLKYEERALKLVKDGVASRIILRVPRGFGGSASEEMHTAQMLIFLKPWAEREQSAFDVVAGLRKVHAREPADEPPGADRTASPLSAVRLIFVCPLRELTPLRRRVRGRSQPPRLQQTARGARQRTDPSRATQQSRL